MVSYRYDTWGKLLGIGGSLANSVGKKNPYRYRGYRYDTETGLYYLQSRYYNPEMGRFINADGIIVEGNLLGNNLYTYCLNNPVNNFDPSGYHGASMNAMHAAMNTNFYAGSGYDYWKAMQAKPPAGSYSTAGEAGRTKIITHKETLPSGGTVELTANYKEQETNDDPMVSMTKISYKIDALNYSHADIAYGQTTITNFRTYGQLNSLRSYKKEGTIYISNWEPVSPALGSIGANITIYFKNGEQICLDVNYSEGIDPFQGRGHFE